MTYPDALEWLSGRQRFGLRPGLETTRRLAEALGSPQNALRFIHVAGTNGKGSTCAFLESILREAGYRVGLYTSPHLVSFRERLQVGRVPIPEAEVARWVDRLRGPAEAFPEAEAPTFFEFVTLMALGWFREQGCDVVVWETGLGGRLDATNIVTPLASVITNIGWDHMQWLGPTLSDIAREKAGILKPGVPALTATTEAEALSVIRAVALERGAPLTVVGRDDPGRTLVRGVDLPLIGEHQVANATLAVATVRTLAPVLGVDGDAVRRGLTRARWPGRFQEVSRGGQTVILDGAHNRPAFEVLARALADTRPGRPYSLVLGMLGDKDPRGAGEWLVRGAGSTLVVPVHSSRGGDPAELVETLRAFAEGKPVGVAGGLAEALDRLRGDECVVVTGSLYLVGEALGQFSGGDSSEQRLNDWSPRR